MIIKVGSTPLTQVHAPVASPESLLEMQIPRPYPKSPESEILGVGPSNVSLKALQVILMEA